MGVFRFLYCRRLTQLILKIFLSRLASLPVASRCPLSGPNVCLLIQGVTLKYDSPVVFDDQRVSCEFSW